MSHLYEVEIKSLLGSKENADALLKKLRAYDSNLKLVGKGKQLNHYFIMPSDLSSFKSKIASLITADKKESFDKILTEGKKLSVRSRDADGKVIFVIKASVGDDSSSNGVKRIEFEATVKMSLDDLDKVLLSAGCTYQAKWSREREEYSIGDVHICLDKNAGYGYLAEFEMVTAYESSLDAVKCDLLSFMQKMGVEELPQDRLERMFAHYNSHWQEYYGTEKTFNIK